MYLFFSFFVTNYEMHVWFCWNAYVCLHFACDIFVPLKVKWRHILLVCHCFIQKLSSITLVCTRFKLYILPKEKKLLINASNKEYIFLRPIASLGISINWCQLVVAQMENLLHVNEVKLEVVNSRATECMCNLPYSI